MQPTLCSRCGKNVAVVFITKIEGGVTKNEGLCLKCARELHIKPVDDVINKMGLSDEDLDGLTGEMMSAGIATKVTPGMTTTARPPPSPSSPASSAGPAPGTPTPPRASSRAETAARATPSPRAPRAASASSWTATAST